ncbi:TonB-dependent siderophore receptor [Pseudomonas sp.]|uniref:TonB-dependent siderophore receptor n=1 Tax=Pseudomonas sp. TaxID=306 RepID=UPI003C73B0F2
MSRSNALSPTSRSRLLSATLRGALCSVALSSALPTAQAWAQEAYAEYDFAIASGPLEDAVAEYSRIAGVTVSFDPAAARDRRSPGVNGHFRASAALDRLLMGSGMQAVRRGEKSYSLQAVEVDGSAIELGATTVSGTGPGGTTEGTGSYTTGGMQTATKLSLTMRQTPQSVTVITRQRMDDQGMNTLDDAVKNTPGLTVQKLGPDRQHYYARGFQVDNLMYDGIPSNVGSNAAEILSSADLAMYDRVEVVRGATGLMTGAGNPSASINLIRKRPTAETQASITTSAGSWDRYRTELDVSGALNQQKTIRGRFVGAYQDNHSFQDDVKTERGVYYGIIEADLSEDTLLTVGASYQNDNNHLAWGGIPVAADGSDLHLSRSTYLGNSWDYWDKDSTFAFAKVEHHFDNDWKLTVSGNKGWGKLRHFASKVNNEENVFSQMLGGYVYDNNQTSTDIYASGPFEFLGRQHELVIGASHRKEKLSLVARTNNEVYDDIDIYDWDTNLRPKPTSLVSNYALYTETELKSGYVTGRFSLADPLHLILGSRLDWYEYDTHTRTADPDPFKVTRNVTKYAGLVYDLDQHHSVYASYTDIFKPQTSFGTDGSPIRPIVGKNYEIGIKGEYFDGALNTSAALFSMDQENRARAVDDQDLCPTSATCYEAAGKVRAQGIDLEIQGALTAQWQVGAGYTYTKTKYLSDSNPDNVGHSFDTDLPRHQFKLTSSYAFSGPLERWRVGGTFYGQNTIYNKDEGYKVKQTGYTLLDLMIGFKPTDKIDARLNLNNVFDKKYYSSITDDPWRAENIYGDPRNLMLSVKYSF